MPWIRRLPRDPFKHRALPFFPAPTAALDTAASGRQMRNLCVCVHDQYYRVVSA